MDGGLVRKGILWQVRGQQIDAFIGSKHTDGGAQQREHAGLGEQLPHNARPARADRRAHRELMLARGPSCQHEDRDISAADQQEQQHRGEEHEERGLEAAHHLFVQGLDRHLGVWGEVGRVLLRIVVYQRLQLGGDLREGDAGLQLEEGVI